ncbi:hypothetical protein BJY52DRAFT_1217840 [Lactarius psammicola]|nr:hypothetical protein BJY52DRAFT_1217840 [Lactarius psammicola]
MSQAIFAITLPPQPLLSPSCMTTLRWPRLPLPITIESLRTPVTSPDPATTGAIRNITSALPLSSTYQPAVVAPQHNQDFLTPFDLLNLPSSASSHLALDNILPTGSPLSSRSPITRSDIRLYFSPLPCILTSTGRTYFEAITDIPKINHISSLIRATQNHSSARVAVYDFFFALCTVWPSRADSVLSTVVVSTSGGLVCELYRGYVRGSPLGGDDGLATLLDAAHADTWPPLHFLTDLYTHSLLTMGDDEFFSGLSAPTGANSPCNPLTLDEITSLSRKFLNIAFTLF